MSFREDVQKMNLSFSGCGFLCIYHAGVCAAIKEYAPQLIQNNICGASAGAIAAAGLICNMCVSQAMLILLDTVRQARAGSLRALSPMFDIIALVKKGLNKVLPENAHVLCTGRLFISLTRACDYKNVVVSEFETRDELIQALVCSSFIPFYCGRILPKFRGEEYIDGGLSDNQPAFDKHTITVSPFSGESDICPTDVDSVSFLGVNFFGTSIQCTSQNLFRMVICLFPPSQDICTNICRQGFSDAIRFLRNRGLAPCSRCLKIDTSLFLSNLSDKHKEQFSTTFKKPDIPVTVRRVKTMPNFKLHLKTYSVGRFEECERCFETFEVSHYQGGTLTDIPLPKVVQKTLDDALAQESKILKYLRTFSIFRWTMRFMTPVIFPIEVMLFSMRRMQDFFLNYSNTDKSKKLYSFVLSEIKTFFLIFNKLRLNFNYFCNLSKMSNSFSSLSSTTKLNNDKIKTNENENNIYNKNNSVLFYDGNEDFLNKENNVESTLNELDFKLSSAPNSNVSNKFLLDKIYGEDSGLSLTEDSIQSSIAVKKRDMACSPIRASVYRSNSQRVNNLSTQSQRHTINSSTETSSCDDEQKRIIGNQISGIGRRYTFSGYRRNLFLNKLIYNNKNVVINNVGSLKNFSTTCLSKLDKKKVYIENDDKNESFDEDGDSKLFVPTRRRN